MGDFLISVAAMTSFMTMVQLIMLALTISPSPGPQASSRSERADGVSGKSQPKRGEKVVRRKSAIHRTRRYGSHGAQASHEQRSALTRVYARNADGVTA